MPSLREFFITEANEILGRLNGLVQRLDEGSDEMTDLQRDVRALRGSAQMAREDRPYRIALGLEAAIRALLTGALRWNEEISARMRRSLEDIAALAERGEADDDADSRVRRSLERWREVGVPLPDEAAPTQPPSGEASRQFQQFAAHEIAGIVSEMDVSLEMLAADPRNRDPLKSILRRQRALLGAARLEELAVIAEALRAVDDMTRLIVKLNAPVKEEWLSVFRSAREVLKAGLDALQRGELPGPTPALSRLRVLRQELIERHGEVDTPAEPPQTLPGAAALSADDVVPIEQLCYSGERALQQALLLRPQLERVAQDDADTRDVLDELFDLIRLGTA